MENKQYIINWLNYCVELNTTPWEYDFKQSYSKQSIQNENGTDLMLKYKNFEMAEIGFRINSSERAYRKGSSADSDKEAAEIYKVLWPLDEAGVIRGDAMNSFYTTFDAAIRRSNNKETLFKQQDIVLKSYNASLPLDKLIENKNYASYQNIQMNRDAFDRFGKLTHTLGNFIVLPHWMNTGRYSFSKDYWDVTMKSFKDFLEPLDAWDKFIKTYQLEVYVNEKLEVLPFWEDHFKYYGDNNLFAPKTTDEFESYLQAVNAKIEVRGKYLTKILLEKLNLKDHIFYDMVQDIDNKFGVEK